MTFMMTAFAMAALTAPDNKTFHKATAWLRTDNVPSLYNPELGVAVTCVVVVLPTLIALINLLRTNKNELQEDAIEPTKPNSSTQLPDKTEAFNEQSTSDNFAVEGDLEKNHSFTSNDESSAEHNNNDYTKCDTCCVDPHVQRRDALWKLLSGGIAGLLFALGLAVSGMVQPAKVLGFLNFYLFAKGTYDPTLIIVMIGGCIVSFGAYQFVEGHALVPTRFTRSKPILASEFSVPCNKTIDWKLIVGAVSFGIGWAIGGLCPGPALFLGAVGAKPVLFYYWPMFIVGGYAATAVKERF